MEAGVKKLSLQQGIIFVDKQSIFIFFEKAKNVFRLDLKPEVVFDLEIVSEELLSQEITNFIKVNAIPPLSAGIILSPAILFIKDYTHVKDGKEIPTEEYESQIKQFIENVPFEDPIEKRYPISKTSEKVVVVNSNFVDSLKQIFTENEFVIPSSHTPFDKGLELFTNGYSESGMRSVLGKIKSFKSTSLETSERKSEEKRVEELLASEDEKIPSKKITPKAITLMCVLGVLILILFGVSFKTFVLDSKSSPEENQPSPIPSDLNPSQVLNTPTEVQNQTSIPKTSVSILIQNGSGISQGASNLSESLKEIGYSKISITNTSTSPGTKNRIVYKSSLPSSTKEEITNLLNTLYNNLTTVETVDLSNDIVITLYDIPPLEEQIEPQIIDSQITP